MNSHSSTAISLTLGPAVIELALQWLVEAPAGEWVDGALIFRGSVAGLAETVCAPLPAADALVRDYTTGGIPLLRVTAPLEPADAYQRPRWHTHGWLVEWLTLDPRVAAVRIDACTIELRLFPPFRGATDGLPFAFALLAAPAEQFSAAWRTFAIAQGLPGAHHPEDRARVLRVATRPTLFAIGPTNYRNADQLIAWCVQAGFGAIMLHRPIWAASNATYAVNTNNWPGGWPTLRAFVDRARAHGLVVGLHTMTTSVASNDPLVTPVPDPRLLSVWSTYLREGVDAGASMLPLTTSPAELSLRDDYMSYGRTVQIDDELITYASIDAVNHILVGCVRGAYGTRASTHGQHATVRYLFRLYDEFAVDPESSLADEVGANLAHAFAETGAEMIYFDDSEAVPDPYSAHVSRYHAQLWHAIGIHHLHVQASSTGAYGTYLLTRVGQQDTVNYKRALLDGMIVPALDAYLRADLVPDLGWFGINSGDLNRDVTSEDDLDCLLARMHGCGGGATVFASPPLLGTALFQQVARRMGLWNRITPPIEQQQDRGALRTPGRDFRPIDTGSVVLLRESAPFRQRLLADATGTITLALDHPGPTQPLALSLTLRPPVDALDSAENRPLYCAGLPLAPSAGASVEDPAVLRWRVTDPATDYARWRLVFSTPMDLTAHRVLAISAQLEGSCTTAVVRLVTGLHDWIMGTEYFLPLQSGVEMTIVDPQVDFARHFQDRWPDPWFSFSIGVKLDCIEGIEIVLVGLTGEGSLALHHVDALRERRPSGSWTIGVEQHGQQYPLCPGFPWDGALTLVPDAGALRVEVREPSGSLYGQWRYLEEDMPTLYHGENRLRLYGFPPNARVDVRVDRLCE